MDTQLYPPYLKMGGAPVDTVTIVNGTTTYFCMALTGTAKALTDKKFKILKQSDNGLGGQTTQHAYFLDTDGKMKGGFKYELAATDLATVSAYDYYL